MAGTGGFFQRLKDKYTQFELGLDKMDRMKERQRSDAAEREYIEHLKQRHNENKESDAIADIKDGVGELKSILGVFGSKDK